jgi:D-tyrosyl-tRNA(Tyr) deacylase
VGSISHGFLLLLGVTHTDTEKDADWLSEKVLNLRLFEKDGSNSFMEQNIKDVSGSILVISQFTVYGDCRKGTRPSFTDSARPEQAEKLYNYFVGKLKESGLKVETGIFAAHMEVELVNDGPVTLLVDSQAK